MDLSTSHPNFNYYDPFDTSSLIKCRNSSTFLISMKSPSLQKNSNQKRSIKTATSKQKPSQLEPFSLENPSSNEEVSRLRSLIFNENKEIQYQKILDTKSQQINVLQVELKKMKSSVSSNSLMNNNENSNNNSENYEEAITFLKKNLQYSIEKCSNTYRVNLFFFHKNKLIFHRKTYFSCFFHYNKI